MLTLSAEHSTSPPPMSSDLNDIMRLLMNLPVVTSPYCLPAPRFKALTCCHAHHILHHPPKLLSTGLYLAGFASLERRVFFPNSSQSPTTHRQEFKDSQTSRPRPVVTCDGLLPGSTRFWQAIWIAWFARANWMGSTRPWWPAWLFGSEIPTRYAAWKGRKKAPLRLPVLPDEPVGDDGLAVRRPHSQGLPGAYWSG